MDDLIRRQAAIDGVRKIPDLSVYSYCSFLDMVMRLPPSEKLTDAEQRIFLAAMEREMQVCREVDEQLTREPYEDSLVWICKEIKRKVKGALWT